MNKGNKGITLIALVITIIILLLLAGIAVASLTGENGILKRTKEANIRTRYTSAKEIVNIKLMDIITICYSEGKEYNLVEIARGMKEANEITIEKYYHKDTALLKPGIIENLVNLKGIVVSVNQYPEFKFLIGEKGQIIGVLEDEIKEETGIDQFKPINKFEEEKFGEEIENKEEPENTIVEVPIIKEDTDITKPIEITTYIAIKNNTINTLNLTGIENIKYNVLEKTENIEIKNNIVKANNQADSKDSSKIDVTGIYQGQNYTNHIVIYVEIKNKTTVEDAEENEKEAFAIYTAQDLVRLRELINYNIGSTQNAVLMNDIDLSSVCYQVDGTISNDISWEPIGSINYYDGIFDGRGNKITNLYINTNESLQGLFSVVTENGILKNFTIGGKIETTGSWVGLAVADTSGRTIEITSTADSIVKGNAGVAGIVGIENLESSFIRKCINNATVSSSDSLIGGITAVAYGTITQCGNNGNITTQKGSIGGVIGSLIKNAIIDNCYNKGNITANGKSDSYSNIGGIAGVMQGKATYCYNRGNVYGKYGQVGGISGNSYQMGNNIVEYCYNTGTITGSRGGSIIGQSTGTSFNFCYWTSTNAGNGNGGNYTNSSQLEEDVLKSYANNLGENFRDDTKNINNGFPILEWE